MTEPLDYLWFFAVVSLSFAASQYVGFEDRGEVTVEIVANNAASLVEDILVLFSCGNGTAVGGIPDSSEDADYEMFTRRLVIAPDSTLVPVTITLQNDSRNEGTEVFFCRLDTIPGQPPNVEFTDPSRGIVPVYIQDPGNRLW